MIRSIAHGRIRYLVFGGFLYAALVLFTVYGLAVLGGKG